MSARIFLYLVISVMFVGSTVFGAFLGIPVSSRTATVNQTLLNATMGQVSCKTNFTVSFLSDVVSAAPNSSVTLTPLIIGLQQDTAQLQSYTNSGDVTSFRSYLIGTYQLQLKTIRTTWASSLREINTSRSTIQTLRLDYNTTKASYMTCSFNKLKVFADEKIIAYNDELQAYQQQSMQLSANGVNTTAINQTLSEAIPQIITPLQNATNAATNAIQLRTAINSYCMYDGCPNGTNYHLAAKFSLEKLTAISAKVSTFNLAAGQRANITTANSDLAVSASTLQTIGTAPYVDGQNATIWTNLRAASGLLRRVLEGK